MPRLNFGATVFGRRVQSRLICKRFQCVQRVRPGLNNGKSFNPSLDPPVAQRDHCGTLVRRRRRRVVQLLSSIPDSFHHTASFIQAQRSGPRSIIITSLRYSEPLGYPLSLLRVVLLQRVALLLPQLSICDLKSIKPNFAPAPDSAGPAGHSSVQISRKRCALKVDIDPPTLGQPCFFSVFSESALASTMECHLARA
jgi:hypothetical protein